MDRIYWNWNIKNHIKHEYLRPRASKCLSFSSSSNRYSNFLLNGYRDTRAYILDLESTNFQFWNWSHKNKDYFTIYFFSRMHLHHTLVSMVTLVTSNQTLEPEDLPTLLVLQLVCHLLMPRQLKQLVRWIFINVCCYFQFWFT